MGSVDQYFKMPIRQMVLGSAIILCMGAQSLSGRRASMEQFRGSVVLNAVLLLTGLSVVVLMCWVLLSGGWLWELW